MKKNISFGIFVFILLLAACSPRKNGTTNRAVQSFAAYYNTLYNGKDALQTELKNRDLNHRDNFYSPYIRLLTYDDQPVGTDLENAPILSESPSFGPPAQFRNGKSATILEIADAKAQKAIAKHSMNYGGEERNKTIFDAYILQAQSNIYRGKPLDALNSLNNIFSTMANDKRVPLARIYQAEAYAEMKDFYRAGEIFSSLDDKDLKKEYRQLKSIYYSQMLADAGKNEQAVAELDNAFEYNKNRKLRSRIAFLRGQMLNGLGKKDEARESFATAYKYANNFEFEVKSQVEIAKTFNGNANDYEGARDYLEKISKKGTYASRKNEFYYALGLMADKAGKPDEAMDFYKKSLRMKISDPQIRGLTYYEIGRAYFGKDDYVGAGAYYDSALAVMTYKPTKDLLADTNTNIKKVAKNYYLVKKNDSILALTRMNDAERNAYFGKFIDNLRNKEALAAKETLAGKNAAAETGFNSNFGTNAAFVANNLNTFQDFSNSSATRGFYFSNPGTIAKGEEDFKRIWGDRQPSDNWRTSARVNTLEDLKNDAMGNVAAKNPRRLEPGYYIEQIPKDPAKISELKKQRDTASLGLGRMYDNYFSNTKFATKTLYDLVDAKPDEDTRLQALYTIFSMNYKNNPAAAERAKNLILSDYPYTPYAEFVKNPKNTEFVKSGTEVTDLYTKAYNFYSDGKFEDSQNTVSEALAKFPKDALVPKFYLLNAYNAGKTAGKEVMILQLQQIVMNYPKTSEGEKAAEVLRYMKSDLDGSVAAERPVSAETQTANIPSEKSILQPVRAAMNQDADILSDDAPSQNNGTPGRPPGAMVPANSVPGRPQQTPVQKMDDR